MKLRDDRAPLTVRTAALLMVVGAVLDLFVQLGGDSAVERGAFLDRWSPWRQLLSFVVSVILAWLIARLNGVAYWFTILTGGLGLVALIVTTVVAGFRPELLSPLVRGGPVVWLSCLLLVAIFGLLIARPSRKAAWAVSNGFSRQ